MSVSCVSSGSSPILCRTTVGFCVGGGFFCFVFLIFVGDMSICGATDTPVLDFW